MNNPIVIPYQRRAGTFGEEEVRVISNLLFSGATLSGGTLRACFESQFAELVGTAYALSVTNGTVALELATRVLDLRPGDEVIATPQTYQATIQSLLTLGVSVRFCDIDKNSINVDPVALQANITPRTRAIFLVHYGGYPAAMRQIMELAGNAGISVVEDCAHALGATYYGQSPGSLGHIGCFSFHSTKVISTLGEGGMVTTDRADWADRIDRMRSNLPDAKYVTAVKRPLPHEPLGPDVSPFERNAHVADCVQVESAGTNATLGEPAAAVGSVQLVRLNGIVEARRKVANLLDEGLRDIPRIRLQQVPSGLAPSYHLYSAFVNSEDRTLRDRLLATLRQRGVEVQLRYFPLHLLPEWRAQGHRLGECPVAERLWFDEQINLPCHGGMTEREVSYIVDVARTALT